MPRNWSFEGASPCRSLPLHQTWLPMLQSLEHILHKMAWLLWCRWLLSPMILSLQTSRQQTWPAPSQMAYWLSAGLCSGQLGQSQETIHKLPPHLHWWHPKSTLPWLRKQIHHHCMWKAMLLKTVNHGSLWRAPHAQWHKLPHAQPSWTVPHVKRRWTNISHSFVLVPILMLLHQLGLDLHHTVKPWQLHLWLPLCKGSETVFPLSILLLKSWNLSGDSHRHLSSAHIYLLGAPAGVLVQFSVSRKALHLLKASTFCHTWCSPPYWCHLSKPGGFSSLLHSWLARQNAKTAFAPKFFKKSVSKLACLCLSCACVVVCIPIAASFHTNCFQLKSHAWSWRYTSVMHYKKQSLARLDTESMSPKGLCKHEPKMGYKAVHTHTHAHRIMSPKGL